jgi:hypothetical protein
MPVHFSVDRVMQKDRRHRTDTQPFVQDVTTIQRAKKRLYSGYTGRNYLGNRYGDQCTYAKILTEQGHRIAPRRKAYKFDSGSSNAANISKSPRSRMMSDCHSGEDPKAGVTRPSFNRSLIKRLSS